MGAGVNYRCGQVEGRKDRSEEREWVREGKDQGSVEEKKT